MPLTVSCFSKIQIGFTFLVPAHPGCPGQMAVRIRVGVLVLWLRFRVGLWSGSGTWGRCSGGREQIPQLLGHGDDGRAERGAGGS